MSWSFGPYTGSHAAVKKTLEAYKPTNEQARLAKEFIIGTLTYAPVAEYSHGVPDHTANAVKVFASGHYTSAGTDVGERHGNCKIEVEHMHMLADALSNPPPSEPPTDGH
jgi:hypothetical protein